MKATYILAASIAALLLQPLAATAGTLFFDDLTDNITVTLSADIASRPGGFIINGTTFAPTPSAFTFTVSGEVAAVTYSSPPGAFSGSNFPHANILEPGPEGTVNALSDTIQSTASFTPTVTFTSDTEGGAPLQPIPGSISIVEDGTIQTYPVPLTWGTPSGNIVDTFQFRSDAVPEPGAFVLSLVGLAGVAARRRRR